MLSFHLQALGSARAHRLTALSWGHGNHRLGWEGNIPVPTQGSRLTTAIGGILLASSAKSMAPQMPLPSALVWGKETIGFLMILITNSNVFRGFSTHLRNSPTQLGGLQFNFIVTLSTWRQHLETQMEGWVPQNCLLPPHPTTSEANCKTRLSTGYQSEVSMTPSSWVWLIC